MAQVTEWAGGADGAPPGDSGRIITYFGATPTTVGPTTTNTSAPGDVCPELTVSFAKKRADSILRCVWGARQSNNTASAKIHTTLTIDAVEYAAPRMRTGFEASGANDQGTPSARVDVAGQAAGAVTVAVYFWVTAGTGKLEGVDRWFYIEEIVLP